MSNTQSIETITAMALTQMRGQLDEALPIAKAAETCAMVGHEHRALQIALDIEPLAVDVNHLLQGISVLCRLSGKPVISDDL